MAEDLSLNSYKRPVLKLPNGASRLLLHSCCAPCAGEVMLALKASEIKTHIFFYNPNIHPQAEYQLRKAENIRYAKKLGFSFSDGDYDSDRWFLRTKGQENEPERGARCTTCFNMRFEVSAYYASQQGFDAMASTLGISRWKDRIQINGAGERATALYPNVKYWDYDWRKKAGSARMLELSKVEKFYQQEYCGCVYSLRDTNRWRASKGRPKIQRGVKFYGQ